MTNPPEARIPLHFTDVTFTASSERQVATGLLGYIEATLNEALRIQGLCLRRTESGRLTITFPEREDRYGVMHQYLVPLNDEVRRHIESQILAALGHREEATG